MKKVIFSVVAFILLASFALSCVSCAKIKETPVLTYGKYSISDAVYKYLSCLEKTDFLFEMYGKDPSTAKASELQDNEGLWTLVDEDGNTLGDTLKSSVLTKMKLTLYLADYAEKNGYPLNEKMKKSFIDELDAIANKYPSRDAFNEAVKDYGVDYDVLANYYILNGLASMGNYLLFGENGKMAISEEAARKYFDKNYSTVRAFFVNTKNKTYPNGKVVFLPEAEKAEKLALADEIEQKLISGEDFVSLASLSDKQMGIDGAGYTFLTSDFGNDAVEQKVVGMKSDEWARVDIDDGIFFIKKIPLDSTQFTSDSSVIKTFIETAKKDELVASVDSSFVLDKALFDALNVSLIKHAQ